MKPRDVRLRSQIFIKVMLDYEMHWSAYKEKLNFNLTLPVIKFHGFFLNTELKMSAFTVCHCIPLHNGQAL